MAFPNNTKSSLEQFEFTKPQSLSRLGSLTDATMLSSFTSLSSSQYPVQQRRNAVVCHSIQHQTYVDRSSRKFKRRSATCGSPSTIYDALQVAKRAGKPYDSRIVPLRTDVIFDENGLPIPDHDGSSRFRQRVIIAFHDQYKFAYNTTHRAIVANAIMNDLMSENCKFYEKHDSPEGGYIEFEENEVYCKIKKTLNAIGSLPTKVRSISAKSA